MSQSIKPYVRFFAQVKGDGTAKDFSFDLVLQPIAFYLSGLPSGTLLFQATAANLPSAVDNPLSQDAQVPIVDFGLTHQIVKFSVPSAIPSGQTNYFQCDLYF
jgi:hypothetical protein